ncbi:NTP transferase domain-containing protein [Maribacter sp. ANRC-HE7]|uniref:NTP transferase domain-containing protein n=1 Tax=Maribacter aquimaris TaxID=2737171 RepID=A0ABR7V4N0_9FLAO|nr:sugar phosphate nucleotidyltransferase [Maribacter aquimaris]MBD0778621.1 NTP transferase domain-containing protein [Maribacter aquimaris]
MDSHSNLVILAGGASSRMKKDTSFETGLSKEELKQANERSKGLIGVGKNGRPLLDYVLYNAKQAGYKNVFIIVGEQAGLFKEFYGNKDKENDFNGLKVSFAVQHVPKERVKPFGTSDALFQAMEQFPELRQGSFTVCNSDNLYSVKAFMALRNISAPNAFIAYDRDALLFATERISRFALAKLDGHGYLLDIIEKPDTSEIEKYKDDFGKLRVSMNVFKFDGAKMFTYLRDCPIHTERNEKELPTAFLNMLKDNPGTSIGIPFSEHVPDLTAKEDIVAVKKYLEKEFPRLDWGVQPQDS